MQNILKWLVCATFLFSASPWFVAHAVASPLIKLMQKDLGKRRPKGCPHKWCACYMDRILAKAGYGPHGSYRARDFVRYGVKTKAKKVGAIMVMPHHIGVVMGTCKDGRVKLISGNYSKKVAVGCYSARKAIAWRAPVTYKKKK